LTPANLDLIGGWVSLVLTLLVFSYLLGDNFLYRIAVHVLVGVAAGYTVIVALESVIVPWLDETLLADTAGRSAATMSGVRMVGIIPFLIGALLLLKLSPRLAPVGDLGMAVVLGVGVGVAMVGAVAGTVVPLAREAGQRISEDATDGAVIVVGVITTLVYFQYFAVERHGEVVRPPLFRVLGGIGQIFVTLALGALYAGAILTSLAIFSDVIRAQLEFILNRVGG
jgi:hypothetical protein